MAYVIQKHEDKMVDAISAPEAWVARDPAYAGMFDRIAETRTSHVEKGVKLHTPEWRKVASMPSTMVDVLKQMSPDGAHLDKKRFYAWLERNPQYKSRDVDIAAVYGNGF